MIARIPPGPAAAVGCVLAALVCFVALDTTTKLLASSVSVSVVMLVWFRFLFQTVVTYLAVGSSYRARLVSSRRPRLQAARGLMLITTTVCAYYSLQVMPVGEFTAIVTLTPLIITLLAVWRLGERVTLLQWLLVGGGLVGAMMVIRPTRELFQWASLLPLVLVVCNAIFQLMTRRLAEFDDSTTTHFYTGVVGTVASSLLLPWAWVPISQTGVWVQVLMLCVFGSLGHLMLILAYARAPASTLTPFLYFQIVFATLAGWLVFSHMPDGLTLAGIALIGLCGSLGTWLAARGSRRVEAEVQLVDSTI